MTLSVKQSTTPLTIKNLPDDILQSVHNFLPYEDTVKFQSTCKRLFSQTPDHLDLSNTLVKEGDLRIIAHKLNNNIVSLNLHHCL